MNFILKRIFDLVFSAVGILTIGIPALVAMLIIKTMSSGPALFKQIRIGRFGKPFTVIKLRTMYFEAERFGTVTASSDSRITPIGRILRRYKLDEFPQLWNVLLGKMSFVGPRPDVPGYADRLQGDARQILELRPGITGPASLYFRNEEEILAKVENPKEYNDTIIWPKKVQLNLEYYIHWSFWKDIGYILVTLFPFADRFLKLLPKSDL